MKKLLLLLLLTLALVSCTKPHSVAPARPVHREVNSVYYWKTVLQLDSAALTFLTEHDVRRIYMRMFDVTADDEWGAIPNATIRIPDREFLLLDNELDSLEIVPVIYITLEGLKGMADHEGGLARNIVKRVNNMREFNSLPNVSELQLDCDWTTSTEKIFFTLCDSIRVAFQESGLPWRLSSTIRLHQLGKKVPPVDAGVLMVYNTGSFSDPETKNSIINLKDVEPYLNKLADYPLHLDIAYPTFSWQLVFRDGQFVGLTNGLDLNDGAKFYPRNEMFAAGKDIPHNRTIIRKGDMVRAETSDINEIKTVKAEIEKRLANREHSNIIYHLDNENLSKYSSDEIENIFTVGR